MPFVLLSHVHSGVFQRLHGVGAQQMGIMQTLLSHLQTSLLFHSISLHGSYSCDRVLFMLRCNEFSIAIFH